MTDFAIEAPLSPQSFFRESVRPTAYEGVAALVDHAQPWCNEHDRVSRHVLTSRVAAFLGVRLLASMDARQARGRNVLLVPGDTIDLHLAAEAGVASRRQLLGGATPAFFVGTKAITHGLVDEEAERPPEWSPRLAGMISGCVLKGFTAFNTSDAVRAGGILLKDGPVRVKDVCGKAGLGQTVVRDMAELKAVLDVEEAAVLSRCGIVLEENLADVVTYSVGAIELDGQVVSYWGRQNLTRDHQGREVYGGSDLFVVRGDLDALAEQALPGALHEVVASAACFDSAARQAYPEAMLTRRNYDVIEGVDARGVRRTGVLEQSWRVGGASGAEVAALEAFRQEPETESVRCSTVEIYDEVIPPPGATIYYAGCDPKVGPMTKFAMRLG